MAKWVTEELVHLLQQINEVPYTDTRELQQLTILTNGFSQLNSKAMDKAAERTKKEFRGWNLSDPSDSAKEDVYEDVYEDDTGDELTRLRPIR